MTRALFAALLFGGGAALGAVPLPGRAQGNATIRLALVPTENAAEAYYAQDMGFFAKAGLAVDITPMQSAPAIAAALAANALDIGYSTVDTLAVVRSKNVPVVIIAPAGEYLYPITAHIAALVVPENSPVQQAKDFDGKVVGTAALHGLAETSPRLWIDQNGGDSSTVKFVEIPFPSIPAALEAHRIDAAFITEPFISAVRKTGRILAYPWDAISKHFLIGGWFTTSQWAQDHPEVVKRFAAVIHDAAVWANKNPAKSGEILAKYAKIDPAVIATMTRSHYAERLTAALVQPLVDLSAKYNGFSTFPARELLYPPSR